MPLRIFFGKEFQMGKFSGVLLASDFDDTLVPTSALRAQGLSVQGTSPENCAALTYFTENGNPNGFTIEGFTIIENKDLQTIKR